MKLLTKLKLRLEGVIKSVNLDCKEKCRCILYRFMSRILKLETRISV